MRKVQESSTATSAAMLPRLKLTLMVTGGPLSLKYALNYIVKYKTQLLATLATSSFGVLLVIFGGFVVVVVVFGAPLLGNEGDGGVDVYLVSPHTVLLGATGDTGGDLLPAVQGRRREGLECLLEA